VHLRGRKPKTASRQIAEGDPSKRGTHQLEARLAAEPKVARGLPPCPEHLKGLARKAWQFWSEELEVMNIACRPDAVMLEGACAAYQTFVRMHERIEEQGELVAKRERNPTTGQMEVVDVRPHPGLAIRDRALALLRSFCSEFGLSPVSRARLTAEPVDTTEEDLWSILSRPRPKKESAQMELSMEPATPKETVQ
jgi:P27 family predicted phage terminase small subunit